MLGLKVPKAKRNKTAGGMPMHMHMIHMHVRMTILHMPGLTMPGVLVCLRQGARHRCRGHCLAPDSFDGVGETSARAPLPKEGDTLGKSQLNHVHSTRL